MHNIKSRFLNIPGAPKDRIFDTLKKANTCENPQKQNLTIGMLNGEDGKLIEYKCVIDAEKFNHESKLNKEYPQIGGTPEFTKAIQELFFSPDSTVTLEQRILTVQTITGGGALRVCAEIISKFLPKKIHLSNETFSPYKNIFINLEICYYPYLNHLEKKLDIKSMILYLNNIEDGSIISFQVSGHNPTATDPTKEQWDLITETMKKKKHLALMDVAYLGYASGSIQEDLYPIHKFAENKIEMLICYSSGKNFANYSDDVGALIVVLNKKELMIKLKSHIIVISRSLFSFVSLYGARIITRILGNENIKLDWQEEQRVVVRRIKKLRNIMYEELQKQNLNINTDYIKEQSGVFMYFGLTPDQVDYMADKFAIFMCDGGRVNVTGLNPNNMDYFANSLKKTLEALI